MGRQADSWKGIDKRWRGRPQAGCGLMSCGMPWQQCWALGGAAGGEQQLPPASSCRHPLRALPTGALALWPSSCRTAPHIATAARTPAAS